MSVLAGVFKQCFPYSRTDIWARPSVFQPFFPGKLKMGIKNWIFSPWALKIGSSLLSIWPYFPIQIQTAGGMESLRAQWWHSLIGLPALWWHLPCQQAERHPNRALGGLYLSYCLNSFMSAEGQPIASDEALCEEQNTFIWKGKVLASCPEL